MKLTVVATLYNSSRFIDEFYKRITASVQRLGVEAEIIFVNDGSPDDSVERALQIKKSDPRVVLIDLAVNTGHHRAMMVGLKEAKSELVYLTDVDLEEPPETIEVLWKQMLADGQYDVYFAKRRVEHTNFFRRWTSSLFYCVFSLLTGIRLSSGAMVSRLMRQKYVEALTQFNERELFIPAVWEIVGFKQVSVLAEKHSHAHPSNYSFLKRLRMAVNAIVSFSSFPLTLIFFVGTLVTLTAFLFVARVIYLRLMTDAQLAGWTSIVASIYLIGGLIIFSIGVLGIYISKIFIEVKQRPYAIVRKIHR